MNETTNLPLVSIVVITYNSSNYVLATLESAKAQTYQYIELIVSDDHSTDDTIAICNDWIEHNKNRFTKTELVTVQKNTGISRNCNRGLYAAEGEWVKLIAGDDLLCNDCIASFILNSNLHKDSQIFFSDVEVFDDNGTLTKKKTLVRNWLNNCIGQFIRLKTVNEQYNAILNENLIIAPSVFFRKSAILALGGYDEEIKLIDDYPLWIKATKSGLLITFINECLVKYRISDSSIQISKRYKASFELFRQKYIFKNVFYYFLFPYIDQLRLNNKDLFFINLLKFSSLPQRIIHLHKRNKSKLNLKTK